MKTVKSYILLGICLAIMLLPKVSAASPQVKTESMDYKVCAQEGISSKSSRLNDVVHFKTMQAITLEDGRTIPAGAVFSGTLIKDKKASGWGCPGALEINFTKLADKDGQPIPVEAHLKKRGAAPNFFVQFSLLGGLVKGNEAVIKAGDAFTLSVRRLDGTNP